MARIDKELIVRNLAINRTRAQELINKGLVFCNGEQVLKSSLNVLETDEIIVKENELFKYVSRGGLKLEKAIKVFNVNLQNKVVLDIGSSTGGFTDCALQNGAKKVVAVDVGTNLMHPSLRENTKVELHENTNIKDAPSEFFNDVDIIVTDVSFISLSKIFERIAKENKSFQIVCLIKPQFECGREIAKKYKGIILNDKIHREILTNIIKMFNSFNYFVEGLDYSAIRGGDGNIEYIAYLTKNTQNKSFDIDKIVSSAFNSEI